MSRRHSPRAGHSPDEAGQPRETGMVATTPSASAELCPEDEAWIEQMWTYCKESGTPVSRSGLRRYLRISRSDHADRSAVLTMIRHGNGDARGGSVSRSVPVDPLGEGMVR